MTSNLTYLFVGYGLAWLLCFLFQRAEKANNDSTISALLGVADHWEQKAAEADEHADAALDGFHRAVAERETTSQAYHKAMEELSMASQQRAMALAELNAMRARTFEREADHGFDVPDDRAG